MKNVSIDVQTRTETCEEHGEFENRGVSLPGGALLRWSGCPACAEIQNERIKREHEEREAKERQRRYENALDAAGIPHRFRHKSFDSFEAKAPAQHRALKAALEFSESFREKYDAGATMIFSGLPGTGKSHLAIAICQSLVGRGGSALYANAMDVIRMVRGSWNRNAERTEAEVLRKLAGVDLLALDEVGAQYGTEGEQVILFDVINRRYENMMPMILMTNQDKDGFKQYLGDRAFDRLRESGKWVAFDWESHRGKQ